MRSAAADGTQRGAWSEGHPLVIPTADVTILHAPASIPAKILSTHPCMLDWVDVLLSLGERTLCVIPPTNHDWLVTERGPS